MSFWVHLRLFSIEPEILVVLNEHQCTNTWLACIRIWWNKINFIYTLRCLNTLHPNLIKQNQLTNEKRELKVDFYQISTISTQNQRPRESFHEAKIFLWCYFRFSMIEVPKHDWDSAFCRNIHLEPTLQHVPYYLG